jgi:acetyl-CoA carboxylase carboxyl transferase subunit alpha
MNDVAFQSTKSSIERVQAARDARRPYTNDLLSGIFTDFIELHGDRRYSDDPAVICGFARIDNHEVAVIGHQKGRDMNQRRYRNFGMPKPEGYRKAFRLMLLAEKFGRPLITFIDTPGAYPGIDAEERGQAEAIAFNLREMANLKISTVGVVLGEGGSGGALAIGVADRILMMENAVYSVISPEGCAAILWKDAAQADRAADSLRLTASDLKAFGLVDEVIAEDLLWVYDSSDIKKGAREDFQKVADELKAALLRNIDELEKIDTAQKLELRFRKFRRMGRWVA